MAFETDLWPFVKAKHFTAVPGGTRRKVDLIVLHTMETPEGADTAESIARWFATQPSTTKTSAHLCIDSNSIVQCVYDNNVAYAAPGANHNGLQIELAGVARQTKEQWRDKYSLALLALAADACAQYAIKYEIPIIHLSDDQLKAGKRGFIGHDQASRVFKKSTHTDPGPNFPWFKFMMWTKACYTDRLGLANG